MSLLRQPPCERSLYGSAVRSSRRQSQRSKCMRVSAAGGAERRSRKVRGKCFVTKDVSLPAKEICQLPFTPFTDHLQIQLLPFDLSSDGKAQPGCVLQNIDTDQIIPAEYLTLVPSKVRSPAHKASHGPVGKFFEKICLDYGSAGAFS